MEALVEEIVCADYSESMKKRFETCLEMMRSYLREHSNDQSLLKMVESVNSNDPQSNSRRSANPV